MCESDTSAKIYTREVERSGDKQLPKFVPEELSDLETSSSSGKH